MFKKLYVLLCYHNITCQCLKNLCLVMLPYMPNHIIYVYTHTRATLSNRTQFGVPWGTTKKKFETLKFLI